MLYGGRGHHAKGLPEGWGPALGLLPGTKSAFHPQESHLAFLCQIKKTSKFLSSSKIQCFSVFHLYCLQSGVCQAAGVRSCFYHLLAVSLRLNLCVGKMA